MILRSAPLVASLLVLSSAVPAGAEEPPGEPPPIPDVRLVLNNLLLARYNPLGLEDQIRFGLQKKLYESESKATRDNFVHAGIYPRLNPAYFKLGPSIELQPATVFNVRLGVEYVRYFGSFGHLQSFPSPASEYSDTQLDSNKEAEQNYVTDGSHVVLEPLVQFQVGPIAVRDKLAIEYWRMGLRGDDRVFYEGTLDTLVPRSGFVFQNDLDVLYILQRSYRLSAGLRYTVMKPLYDETDFPFGSSPNLTTFEQTGAYRGNSSHRIGPVAALTFYDDGYTSFNKPTVILMASWYLHHRYRTGQDVSGAVPLLLIGFSFQSDLLPSSGP